MKNKGNMIPVKITYLTVLSSNDSELEETPKEFDILISIFKKLNRAKTSE